DHFFGHHHWSPARLRCKGADGKLASLKLFREHAGLEHRSPQSLADVILQSLKTLNAVVENLHRGAETQARAAGVFAYNASTDDDNFCCGDAGAASEQHALAVVGRAEVLRGDQHHCASRDLAHAAHDGI